MGKNKIIMLVISVLIVVAVVLWAVMGSGKSKIMVAPDKVATVNGVVITKTAYDEQMTAMVASLKAQGVNTEDPAKQAEMKKQVLDNLINNELITQGIKSAGIVTTDAEVETQFQTIVTQNGGAEGFQKALTTANLTEAKLRTDILNQLNIQKYLAANVKVSGIKVTDAEVKAFYDQYKATNDTSTPALKTISTEIKQQITQNKQQALVAEFIAALKAKATIIISI